MCSPLRRSWPAESTPVAGAAGSVSFAVLSDDAPVGATEAERIYGAALRFPSSPVPFVYANFVQTIDGVVSLGLTDGTDSSTLSGRFAPDRFLMAMLRAAADVVLVGVGTLRDSVGHQWLPDVLLPEYAAVFAEYRREVSGKTAPAALAIVSATGRLPEHVALREPATEVAVVTTVAGSRSVEKYGLRGRRLIAGDGGALRGVDVMEALRREFGGERVLCEGGPLLFGSLMRDRAVHELFLTIAPKLAGRDGERSRPGLIRGFASGQRALLGAEVESVRRSGDYLFLRYRLVG